MSYYNTNNEKGETLKKSKKKAQTQQEEVLELFKLYRVLSASMAWRIYGKDKAPLTSIRRAVTDLCKKDLLEKTDLTANGIYGKAEYIYKLA